MPHLLLDPLEPRWLMTNWGPWPSAVGMDKVFRDYPWLDGGTNSIAVVDKGIDYYPPYLGGIQATSTVAPRIVNVYDWRDNDNTPFPSESEATDTSSAHGTGVAGLLIAPPFDDRGYHFQGILQSPNSKLYNLRINRLNSQPTIQLALQWVIAHRVADHITAINLTDFVGSASTPQYAPELAQLKAAGVFIASPVANDWILEPNPRGPIGYPAKSPDVFGIGGVLLNRTLRPQTQRGPELDLIGPSESVTLPYYTPSSNTHTVLNIGSGNSWATPHVVGAAVLLQQIDPTITPDEIMEILQDSGTPTVDPDTVSDPNGDIYYDALNMYSAVGVAYKVRDDIYDQGTKPNDNLAHAGVIPIANGSGSVTNLKLLTHDADYFKFTVSTLGDYDVTLTYGGVEAFPSVQLLDAAGNPAATIGSDGITRRLAPGDYYIKAISNVSLTSTYSIAIDPGTPIPAGIGSSGTYNGLAVDGSGNVNFAWFDSAAGKLKFAKQSGGVWSSASIVDNSAGTGNFMSLALDSTGKPGIAYYDEPNTALKYAHFNGATWDITTIDSDLTTGYYPSLKFAPSNKPSIAYYYKSSGDLRFATFTGSAWAVSTIDSRGDVGRYPSLALNPISGRWGIAYEKTTTGDFRIAEQAKGGTWGITVVDPTKYGGGFISLAYTSTGRGAFSYYDAFNSDLKYASFNGSKWVAAAVAAKNSQGLYTNLLFDPISKLPLIYYFNKTSNSAMVARNTGSAWAFSTAAIGGGRQVFATLAPSGDEVFSFLDDGTGDLSVAFPV